MLKTLALALSLIVHVSAHAESDLSFRESLKTSHVTVASVLALLGLHGFSAHEVRELMIKLYQNDDTLAGFAAKAGCATLSGAEPVDGLPQPCFCTDNFFIFNRWLAPVFAATTGAETSELFAERRATLNGHTFILRFNPNGTIYRGMWKGKLQDRMHFAVFIDGKEHGDKKRQQFCSFNGTFRMFTETNGEKYIGINLNSLDAAIKSARPLSLDHTRIENGEISYRE